MEQLVSVKEAARLLGGLSKWTIYAWLGQGKLPRVKVGSRTMIRASDLERMIEDDSKSARARRDDAGTVVAKVPRTPATNVNIFNKPMFRKAW